MACAAGPAGAITDDWVSDDVHDYVGLVVLLDEEGEFLSRCSGALIDDTTVLTAGHCTDGASTRPHLLPAGRRRPLRPGRPSRTRSRGYPDECAPGTLGVWCVESDSLYDAGFDEFASFPDTHDVGLVILDGAAVGRRRPGASCRGRRSSTRWPAGPSATARCSPSAATGSSGSDPQHVEGFRSRLMASSRRRTCAARSTTGSTCRRTATGAASRRPARATRAGRSSSATSRATRSSPSPRSGSNSWCRGTDFSYRIDRAEVLAWIGGGYLETRAGAVRLAGAAAAQPWGISCGSIVAATPSWS